MQVVQGQCQFATEMLPRVEELSQHHGITALKEREMRRVKIDKQVIIVHRRNRGA